jgi:hypothetical protein
VEVGETARSTGLERLYHYERFNPEYLRDTLVNQRIHCSDPAALNDPWDCRPWFDEEVLDDPSAVDALFDFFFASNPTAEVSEAEKRASRAHAHRDRHYSRQILNRFSEDFLKVIPNRWRIYCLTPFPDSTLMWSHYADNHRGICLEFALGHPLLGSAQKVEYLSSYPKWSPQSLFDGSSQRVLLTKSDDWDYEQEYRIIGLRPRPEMREHPLFLDGDYLRLPDCALRAVIIGCEAEFDKVSDVMRRNAPDLEIRRAVRSPLKYRLEIVSVGGP